MPELSECERLASLVQARFPARAAMLRKNWRRYSTVAEFLFSHVPPESRQRILDYGCGFPFVTAMLLERGLSVRGFEPYATDEELAVADALGVREQFCKELPAGETFSCSLLVDVIEHLAVIKPVMQDVAERTEAGGCLLISTPNVLRLEMWLAFVSRRTGHPQSLETYLDSDNAYVHHQREFTAAELKRTVMHFGFEPLHLQMVETTPDPALLREYHQLTGNGHRPVRNGARQSMGNFVKRVLPGMRNNLLLVARKRS